MPQVTIKKKQPLKIVIGQGSGIEKDVALQTCVELMIYSKELYVIAPKGYINPNNTDVEFARYVKTSARYYKNRNSETEYIYRAKKKGWFTPKYTAFGQEYNPVVCFVLREKTDNFKYIRATNRQIYEVSFADGNEFDGLNIEEAFSLPIYVNKGSVMRLTNTKLGIRLVSNDTRLPITDWLPFCVRYNKYRTPNGGEAEFVGLSRWV